MWHEARRQERKIRGIMVDFKRRADRRKEFYEKIKQDPTQFLRMYGRPAKIHLDPSVAMAAEGPQSMMPWQGDSSNMIDRFDVRANLDLIPPYVPDRDQAEALDEEERFGNYERYRTLVENEAAGLTEEQCLHQIYLDEHFGTITKSNEEEKKKNADKKAAIGFVYEDSTPANKDEDEENEEDSEEDIETADLDITIDIDDLTPDQVREVNGCASHYGMKGDDFSRLLKKDKEELEMLKEARQLEEAKAQFSGRKSRRERRAINEKRQNPQRFNRPSYAARESPKYEPYKRPGSLSPSRSRSRSRSSEAAPVTFITSFGADSDEEAVVQGPALPANLNPKLGTSQREKASATKPSKCEAPWRSGQRSDLRNERRRMSSSRSRSRSSRSRSRSLSRSRPLRHRTSKSSSRSISRSKSRSRSRSRSGRRRGSRPSSRRSRSSSSRSSSRSRSRSRSRSTLSQSAKRSASPAKKLTVKRYRRDSLSSKSELSGLESDDDNKNSSSSRLSPSHRAGTSITKSDLAKCGKLDSKAQPPQSIRSSSGRETMKERLKRKMQAQLNRQFKADKRAEITRISKQEQERMDREEEIRNMALEIRRREREKRHKEREEEEKHHQDSSSDSDQSSPGSPRRRRSRSRSPTEKRDRERERERPRRGEERSGGDRRDSRASTTRGRSEDRSSRDERRKSPPRSRPGPDPRSGRSDDRHGDRHREQRSSKWGEGSDGREAPRSSREAPGRQGLLPRPDRASGGHSGLRDGDWGRQRYGAWDDAPPDWADRSGGWGRRAHGSAGYNSNGRPRQPLLQRPRSPLMSRPRPPNDPRLMEG